ncbi:hypothetical protein [Streptomyces sp. NPDC048361]
MAAEFEELALNRPVFAGKPLTGRTAAYLESLADQIAAIYN